MMLSLLLACSSPERTGLPDHTEAAVLLLTASNTSVTVDGAVLSPQHLDLDTPEDDRDGFRYQILDGNGAVLYERSTNGPPLVQAFLNYWGGVAGIDALGSLPTLGRFFLHVPLLDEGRSVNFQYRDGDSYQDVGRYDLNRLDADDQGVLEVIRSRTVHDAGDSANRLDLVILPDGYTEDELPLFHEHVDTLTAELFSTPPFDTLAPLINIHRVDVASNDRGAGFDCETCGPKDTAFGSIFAVDAINRFSGSTFENRAMLQSKQWAIAQAASVVPWDLALVLTHTERPAGLAVHAATASTGWAGWEQTAVHELGHIIGLLGDEYNSDACIRSPRLGLPVNITARGSDPPWSHWIEPGTTLPSPSGGRGMGAHAPAYNCPDLYRPRANCLMNSGTAFCPVCTEALVRRVMRFADPVDAIEHDGARARVVGPMPVQVEWLHGDKVFRTSAEGEWVRVGSRPFVVRATLETDLVREDPYGDLDLVSRYE